MNVKINIFSMNTGKENSLVKMVSVYLGIHPKIFFLELKLKYQEEHLKLNKRSSRKKGHTVHSLRQLQASLATSPHPGWLQE